MVFRYPPLHTSSVKHMRTFWILRPTQLLIHGILVATNSAYFRLVPGYWVHDRQPPTAVGSISFRGAGSFRVQTTGRSRTSTLHVVAILQSLHQSFQYEIAKLETLSLFVVR
mmetsp:Transcript_32938/g.93657  ORF Transcript_32938/g.93657 Transcript_32938/m.93657 type:complete len:112 (+) Transcript_32938:99-434(+)